MTGTNPDDIELRGFIDKGVQAGAFEAAAVAAIAGNAVKPWNYLLAIIGRQVTNAARVAAGSAVQQGAWDATRSSIEAKAAELGMQPWNEHDVSANREQFSAYTARVRAMFEACEVSE